MPPILGGNAILFAFVCRLLEDEPNRGMLQIRDHVIVAGEVEEVVPGCSSHQPKDVGVVYGLKKFWKINEEIRDL